jgi:hypothetical protein
LERSAGPGSRMPNRFDPLEPQRGETTSFARSTLHRHQRLSRPYRALAHFGDDENPGLRCASTWALSVSPLQGSRLAILPLGGWLGSASSPPPVVFRTRAGFWGLAFGSTPATREIRLSTPTGVALCLPPA